MEQQQNQTKTIREIYAHNRLWVYLKSEHKINLDDEQLTKLVEAVDQYKKDLVNGMSTKPIESY
jgi:hypothetical protein